MFKNRESRSSKVSSFFCASGIMMSLSAILLFLLVSGSQMQAQTFPPAPVTLTPVWDQNFSGFKSGVVWPDLDGDKEKAFPADALIQSCPATAQPTPVGETTSSNCFVVIFNKSSGVTGIDLDAPTIPVFITPVPGSPDCDAAGTSSPGLPCIGWSPAAGTTTNTGTNVVQNDIMVNAQLNPLTEDPISESGTPSTKLDPSYSYTLSYDVYFPAGFDFAKGGKLPGLSASDFDSGCTDDGSVKRTPNRWSERVMWRENGRVELYSYDQSRPSGNCGIDELVDALPGDPAYEYPEVVPGNGLNSNVANKVFRFQTGVWYTITISVAVNNNNEVLYATDGSGNTLDDAFGDPIVIGGNGLVNLTISTGGQAYPLGTGNVVGSIQYNNVALRDECDTGAGYQPNGSAPNCGTTVPDTTAARVNGLFYSTFYGGNETKRLTCLNDTIPAGSPTGMTQATYEELCGSQRVEYIFPTNTWRPQTESEAYYGQFVVYPGYAGLEPTVGPQWTSPATTLNSSVVSASEIDLCWTPATPASGSTIPITGYKVYSNGGILLGQVGPTGSPTASCQAGEIYFPVTNIAGVALSAPLSTATPTEAYYFFVKAYDQAGNQSAFSNETYNTVSLTSPAPSTMLAPGSVTSNVLPNGVNAVFWAPQLNAVSYNVYRNGTKIAAGIQPASACGALGAQEVYNDTTGVGGTAYNYTVTAVNPIYSVPESPQSLPTTATPSNSTTAPPGLFLSVPPPYCQSAVAGASIPPYKLSVIGTEASSATVNYVNAWPPTTKAPIAIEFGALYTALPTGMTVAVSGTSSVTVATTTATPIGTYPINLVGCTTSSCTDTTAGAVWTQLVAVVAPAAPVLTPTPTAGSYVNATQVTIAGPTDALVYYTTDGSTPTINSNLYSNAIAIPTGANIMISAIAVINNTPSATTIGLYTDGTTTTIVTVTANNQTMVGGSSVPTLTYTLSPMATPTTAPACTTTATSSSPAGTYPITCSGAVLTGDTFTYVTGTLTVTPATQNVTVTASNQTMVAGSSLPTFTYTLSPVVTPTTAPTCTTTATKSSPAGTYPITCSGAVLTGDTFTYVAGTLTVTSGAQTITITADNITVVHDGTLPPIGYTVSPAGTTLTFTPSCFAKGSARSPVGTYETDCSGTAKESNGDPVVYVPGTLTVTAP
jgi:hypothetical protein